MARLQWINLKKQTTLTARKGPVPRTDPVCLGNISTIADWTAGFGASEKGSGDDKEVKAA